MSGNGVLLMMAEITFVDPSKVDVGLVEGENKGNPIISKGGSMGMRMEEQKMEWMGFRALARMFRGGKGCFFKLF